MYPEYPQRRSVYLDYAATSPVAEPVEKAMDPLWRGLFGNPSSIHRYGQDAAQAVDVARDQLAAFFGCKRTEVIFTSGATEANNLAIRGLIAGVSAPQPHIITSVIEHPSVLATCRALEQSGQATVTYLPVDETGRVVITDVLEAITDQTVLVSLMYANNEIGTVQPVAKIAPAIAAINTDRQHRIFLHTDATQAIQFFDISLEKLPIDMVSCSAHKVYGPKGVGALIVRADTPLTPITFGGEQEYGLRSGTVPVQLVAGFGAALKYIRQFDWRKDSNRIEKLRDRLWRKLHKKIPQTKLNGSLDTCLPNICNVCFTGVDGEALMTLLDMQGIGISLGSACAAGKVELSETLTALGLPKQDILSSLRFSLGKRTSKYDIDHVVETVVVAVEQAGRS